MHESPKVYVVDDDESVRYALDSLLSLSGFRAEAFESVEEFLKVRDLESPSCLVLDVTLPGMSGLEFQDKVANGGPRIPIIFITAQGDIPMTRRALRGGAVDFLTKPFRKKEFLAAIDQAIEKDRERRRQELELETLESRYRTLTSREAEVFEQVVAGLLNKQIADRLCLSEASIKFHRAHVMQKMKAASVPDLVRMLEKLNYGLRN